MSPGPTASHWEAIYRSKNDRRVSWYAPHLRTSLSLIEASGVSAADTILDVGGGASTLVDDLLQAGYRRVLVLDLAAPALQRARERLDRSDRTPWWLVADAQRVPLSDHSVDLWHDRAVFHFLTEEEARRRYVGEVRRTVRPGGHVIVATFGPEGPTECSGLPVERYAPDRLHDTFGLVFTLIDHREEHHQTPSGTIQQFMYCYCRRG